MKIRFIINPVSGTGKQEGIELIIAQNINNYDIVYTKKTGDACELSKKAVLESIDAIIAVGGDGTVNECLKSLVNTLLTVITEEADGVQSGSAPTIPGQAKRGYSM